MTEWIVAPLLAADPTSRPVYRPGESDAAAVAKPEPAAADRRGADRREPHVDTDDDFGRGEDRRDSAA